MKFLIINGKLQKGGNGKFVTVPDNYNNEPLKLNDKVLMIGGKVVGNNPKGESVLSKLATPQNVIIDGTTLTFDEVENATSYAVFADGSEIGTVEKETGSTDATVTITNTSTRYIANVGTSYNGGGMANPDIGTVGTNSTETFTIPKGTTIYISANTNMGYDSFVSTSITGNITEESSGGFLAKMIINGDGTITGYANNAD